MAAEGNSPDLVRVEDVKRLDPSLTLKRNRSQLEALVTELQKAVRNDELQGGLIVRAPLSDGRIHELTVSHSTREGLSTEEQKDTLFWSDYAALMLDVAQKFKLTDLRDEFSQYDKTARQLDTWAHQPNAPSETVDELTMWNNRYKAAELLQKLSGALSTGITETEEEVVDEEPDKDEKTTESEDEKAKKLLAALAAQKDEREANSAVVTAPPGGDDGDTAQPASTEPNLEPDQKIDPSRPLTEQLSRDQLRQYNTNVAWMSSFTLLQIADSMGVDINQLDPALRAEITNYATDFLAREGDINALLRGSPTARLRSIRGLQRYLTEKSFFATHNVSMGIVQKTDDIFEKKIHTILGDNNGVVDKNIEKTVDAIIIAHGDKAAELIQSFDKKKIELIFGLETYNLQPAQIEAFKSSLISYAQVRIVEIVLHTQDEAVKDGLVTDTNPSEQSAEQLASQISSVRATISQHSSNDDEKGELTADATTHKTGSTSKKITFALGQNEKIFGSYWRSLSPELQAVALVSLGAGHLVKQPGDHPPGGYEMPINIAEFNPSVLGKYAKAVEQQQKIYASIELEMAQEIFEYNVAVERAEVLAMNMQAEYIKQNEMVLRLQMAQEIALEQASLQQMMTTESALEEPQRQTDSPSNKLSKTMRSVGRKKSASAAGSQAKELASKKLNTAVAGATQKALGAIPGVGAALAGGHIALSKMIGEKNTNKLMLFLGGGAAAGIGYVVAKTLQALQTLGGMIGGAVGGFAGSFLGIGGTVVGFIGGANLGAAAQNWLAGIFGKGAGASTTSFGSSGLGGSVLSGGSSLPTLSAPSAASVAQGATTVTNAAGNVVGGITKAVGQATQSLPSASAVATQPLASTPFLEGLKAASQAGAKLIYSIPFMSVILGMSIPALYTIIVFLVIMGAFLVPMPFTINSSNPSISEYALISKTASPEEIENNVEEDITYVINIVPKSGYQLEIKRVDDEFLVLGGDATTPTSPLSLTSFEAGKFSSRQEAEYTVTLSGEDALVINTVTFTVDVFDSSGKLVTQGESISALGLVIIGDPPIGCFEFAPAGITTNYEGGSNTSIEWNQQDIVKFLKAFINRVGTNPQYLSLLCSEGDITVHKWPAHPEHFWGWQVNENKIGFYAEFFDASTQWMEYTLVHESGHLINDRNPGLQNQFTQIQTDAGCFTYPFPGRCSESEAFAEALVDYVVWQTHSFSFEGVWTGVFPFKTMYPSEYAWMQTNIFGGIEY